jgi:hypothetical protein
MIPAQAPVSSNGAASARFFGTETAFEVGMSMKNRAILMAFAAILALFLAFPSLILADETPKSSGVTQDDSYAMLMAVYEMFQIQSINKNYARMVARNPEARAEAEAIRNAQLAKLRQTMENFQRMYADSSDKYSAPPVDHAKVAEQLEEHNVYHQSVHPKTGEQKTVHVGPLKDVLPLSQPSAAAPTR